MKRFIALILSLFCFVVITGAQTEILNNAQIVEMSKIGLGKEIILKKIDDSQANFDVTTNALIELKKGGVADEIIARMLEKSESKRQLNFSNSSNQNTQVFSESEPTNEAKQYSPTVVNAKDALLNAKTVAIEKSSLNPSRQSLEKELLKRKEWLKYNLTLVRYKQDADIYIEIGFVPLSLITHRYVFRIYDRRSGTIIAAGETTSWGSLSHNLAREITQKMDLVSGK